VVDIKGRQSHDIVERPSSVLVNLEHRGAAGAERNTGRRRRDLTLQTPDAFLRREARKLGIELPAPGRYAARA